MSGTIRRRIRTVLLSFVSMLVVANMAVTPVAADPFSFSTGNPDGKMATGSRPDTPGVTEIESADDFVLSSPTVINKASFTGLLTGTAQVGNVGEVAVEVYRVFPNDSDTGRTIHVPTRTNSPSDVALVDLSTSGGGLSVKSTQVNATFTAANSVLLGIHPSPAQTTGGEGAVTGREVQFDVTFSKPLVLPADHYFFVPQVQVSGGDFLWLSAPRPIVPPGTPFPAGTTDLQSWIRNAALDPDWLRVGMDIVGGSPAPAFNATFSLSGDTIPEPASLLLVATGLAGLLWRRRKTAW